MKKTRVMAFLTAILMLVSSLCACGEPPQEQDTSAATQNSLTQATEEASDAATELTDNLPDDLDYGQDEIVILSRYREGWTSGEISVTGINSEPVNDAIYERNQAVEDRLNVKIVSIEDSDFDAHTVVNKVSIAVKAGTHEYDILAAACYVTLNESLNGTFTDLRKSVYLDFNQPWWSQGYNEVVEYHGAQFAGLSSALLSQYRFAFVTVFNKDMFQSFNQKLLYDYVEDGTWTLDKQISLVPIFHQDNGNGIQDEEGDIYGLVSNDYASTDPYWSSCMVDIIKKDENGDYEYVFDSGKLHNVCEKTQRLFYGTDGGTYDYKMEALNTEQDKIRDMFARSGAAMSTLRILELESSVMRGMKDEFGVVPMPKYDEIQKEYRTLLHDQFTVFSIPKTISEKRFDEMGAVLEAMASVSYKIVRPAYYETNLRTKIAKDPQSAKMFDIIIDNIYIDAGIIYVKSLNYFHNHFRETMGTKENTVVSRYKAVDKSTRTAVNAIGKKLDRVLKNEEK